VRILLVEDQSDAAQVLAKGLREHSYAVDIAPDGEAALYQTSINDYDLILLDVMLPRKNGSRRTTSHVVSRARSTQRRPITRRRSIATKKRNAHSICSA